MGQGISYGLSYGLTQTDIEELQAHTKGACERPIFLVVLVNTPCSYAAVGATFAVTDTPSPPL